MEQSSLEAAISTATSNVSKTVTLRNGKTVDIYLCKLKQIPHLLRFARAVLGQISASGGVGALVQAMESDVHAGALGAGLTSIVGLLESNYSEMMEVVTLFCSLPSTEFEELGLDEGVIVVSAIWDANKGFFMQSVLPLLRQMAERTA